MIEGSNFKPLWTMRRLISSLIGQSNPMVNCLCNSDRFRQIGCRMVSRIDGKYRGGHSYQVRSP